LDWKGLKIKKSVGNRKMIMSDEVGNRIGKGLLSSGVSFLVHANWNTFLYVNEKPTIFLLKKYARHNKKLSRHGELATAICVFPSRLLLFSVFFGYLGLDTTAAVGKTV
jgi:hypothetical protein